MSQPRTTRVPAALGPDSIDAVLRAAVRAPSSHNTQPWAFRVEPGTLLVYADRTRGLAVNDPDDRELTISCGAAIFNLLVAARHHGAAPSLELLPNPSDRDLMARVGLHGGTRQDPGGDRLYAAIEGRQTIREPFDGRPVSDALLAELVAAADAEGARLQLVVDREHRGRIVDLIGEGDRILWASRHWRRELASWMHPRRSGDGLVMPGLMTPVAHATVAELDLGSRVARRDEARAGTASAIAILASRRDRPRDWLIAGMALERVLLRAATEGVQVGP